MAQIDNPASYLEQVLNQFSSYLQGIASTVTQIKSLVYSLINISLPLPRPLNITSDYHSIMTACKRIHDDLKRTESILNGHAKARSISEQSNTTKMQDNDKKIDGQIPLKRITKSQIINANESTDVSSPINNQNFDFDSLQIKRNNQNRVDMETKLPRNADYQVAIEEEQYINDEVQQHASQPMLELNSKELQIQSRIQNLRKNREQDLLQFVNENEECLNLIKRIREDLIEKKKRRKVKQ